MIDMELYEKAVPLATLMEYISQEITKSKLMTNKARIVKAIALLETGYINESYQIFLKLIGMKNLPTPGSRSSDFKEKKEGKLFFNPLTAKYHNSLPPESDKNKEAIETL